jgi:hypothetical protein
MAELAPRVSRVNAVMAQSVSARFARMLIALARHRIPCSLETRSPPRLAARIGACMKASPVENSPPQSSVPFSCRRLLGTRSRGPVFPPVGEFVCCSLAIAPSRILRWFPRPVARQARRSCGERDGRYARLEIPQRSRKVRSKPREASGRWWRPPRSSRQEICPDLGIFAAPGFWSCR